MPTARRPTPEFTSGYRVGEKFFSTLDEAEHQINKVFLKDLLSQFLLTIEGHNVFDIDALELYLSRTGNIEASDTLLDFSRVCMDKLRKAEQEEFEKLLHNPPKPESPPDESFRLEGDDKIPF